MGQNSPGKACHQLAGQGGEVVGVEGEGDQLGQVGQGGGVQAPDLVVVQLEERKCHVAVVDDD